MRDVGGFGWLIVCHPYCWEHVVCACGQFQCYLSLIFKTPPLMYINFSSDQTIRVSSYQNAHVLIMCGDKQTYMRLIYLTTPTLCGHATSILQQLEQEGMLLFYSVVRGHHVFKNVWTPTCYWCYA